jgi:hypothetical protein
MARMRLDRHDAGGVHHARKENRVVAGVGAGVDDPQPARKPFGQEAQLIRLEELAAHLFALDYRVHPRIGKLQSMGVVADVHEDWLALQRLDEPFPICGRYLGQVS